MPASDTAFGLLLRRFRNAAGFTQEALAERAGVSTRTISDLERGVNAAPRPDTLDLLAAALGIVPEQRTALIAAARPEAKPGGSPPNETRHIPIPPSSIVGREDEVGHVCRLLDQGARLVTLVGVGGVGKTRLALEIAHRISDAFTDGAVFADLSAVRDVGLVPTAILLALGVRESSTSVPMERLRATLEDRHLLLVLDNLEQLLEGAPLLAELLVTCAKLTIVVTSRAPLRLRAEFIVAVAPLPIAEATVLFGERLWAVRPDLDPPPELAAAICERVDRLPLAIELVAAQSLAWPLASLLEQLRHRLPVLADGPRDLPERQRTMRDAIAWSYALLSPAQQSLFRALAVFAGGCTADAARAVWGRSHQEAHETERDVAYATLRALVDHHLVRTDASAGSVARFSMLEVLREFARERLRAAGEEEIYERRHAEYFAALAADALARHQGQDMRDAEMVADLANARTACRWAQDHQEANLGLTLSTGFGRIWYMQGLANEATRWTETMLALDAAESGTSPAMRAMALYGVGRAALDGGDAAKAEMAAREGLELARAIGDPGAMASLLTIMGQAAQRSGDLTLARTHLDAAVDSARQSADNVVLGTAISTSAQIAKLRGEFTRAFDLLNETLSLFQTPGTIWGAALTYTHLGLVANASGEYRQALDCFREALTRYRALGNRLYVAWCMEGLAATLCSLGRYDPCVRICGAAAALRAQEGAPLPPDERATVDAFLASARDALGDSAYARAWAAASAWTRDDAFGQALDYATGAQAQAGT